MASLSALSDRAESCADLFLKFRDLLPASSAAYVKSVVSELFSISNALSKFRQAYSRHENERYLEIVTDDLRTATKSLQHTLRDVERQLAPLEEMRDRGLGTTRRKQDNCREAWRNLQEHFATEGARIQGCETLIARLETYRAFIDDLQGRLEGDGTNGRFKDMQYRLEKLLMYQEKSLDDTVKRISNLALEPPANPSPKKHGSWERRRPPKGKGQIEAPPGRGQGRNRYQQRMDTQKARKVLSSESDFEDLVDDDDDEDEDDGYYHDRLGSPVDFEDPDDDEFNVVPPTAPAPPGARRLKRYKNNDIPSSPLYQHPKTGEYFVITPDPAGISSGAATPSVISSETNSSVVENHWVSIVFGQPRSSTAFRTTGSESGCFGESMSGVTAKLKDEFEEIMKLPFDDGNLQLKIYLREDDFHARLLVRQERGNRRVVSCQAVANLRIIRRDSCLQLCLPDPKERHVILWTLLNFPTYERMVLFWCSFLALKAQDEAKAVPRLDDASLDGETVYFSAVIIDDNYEHALHILRDKNSKGVRLQASALRGPLKRTPIWTAFITHQISSRTWARHVENRKIHLQELSRYVFTADYEPQLGPRGEHELCFTKSKDAKAFRDIIDEIAEGRV